MNKIALITDTASDITKSMKEKYNVNVFHFQIVYKDRSYKDQLEITSKQVLETIDEEAPTTSLPLLSEMQETFKRLQEEGYTQVIAITISSGLSGCYNAVNMVAAEYPELETHVFDSKTLSIAQCKIVEVAGEMIEQGKSCKEIIEELQRVREKQHTLFIFDELKYLVRGGRIGHVSAGVGKILNLKPIVKVGDDGKYISETKARGKNKALAVFVEKTKTLLANKKCEVHFIHADARVDIEKLASAVEKQVNIQNLVNMELWDWISPVACVHTGPGFIGMLVQEVE